MPRKSSEGRELKRPATWSRVEVTPAMPCYADSPFGTTGLMALKASSGRRHLPKTKAQLLTLWFGRFPVSRRGCLSTACVLLTARFFCAGARPSVAQKPYLIECSTKGAYADSGGEEAAAD